MALARIHPEDIKAGIRKRYGSVAAFERCNDLPAKSVSDLLRGRVSARVEDAIKKALKKAPLKRSESELSDITTAGRRTHRINAGGR